MKTAIEIIIAPTGEVTIDAVGFHGVQCEKATAFLEQALGKIEARQRKPEWHQQSRRTIQQKAGV